MIGTDIGANNTVFIGDLSFFCTKQDLEDLFTPFGRIVKIRIKQNEGKKKSLAFGFIEFESNQDACVAMDELDGQMFLGRALRCVYCVRLILMDISLNDGLNVILFHQTWMGS